MDKSDENFTPLLLSRKHMINVMGMAGLLAHLLFEAFPLVKNQQWHEDQKVFIKAYSCGYSSGLSPDSLLFHVGRKPTSEPFPEANVMINLKQILPALAIYSYKMT